MNWGQGMCSFCGGRFKRKIKWHEYCSYGCKNQAYWLRQINATLKKIKRNRPITLYKSPKEML